MSCKCGPTNKTYLIHYDSISCEPVRIDFWMHHKKSSKFISSHRLTKKDSKSWLNPLFYCGNCSSAMRNRYYTKEDYFMSIDESRGA